MLFKIRLGILLAAFIIHIQANDSTEGFFPDDFMFGVATSAYQIEGAWNKDGKTESAWDYFAHTYTEIIRDGSNGDVACDSYHKYERDVEMLKYLGVDYYRFSIAWTRILPNPLTNNVNQAGIDYYNKLIDLLLANGIKPMVTLFHWDLPQSLQKFGGFTNSFVIPAFKRYAKVVFENFGDRVKFWMTFNQPRSICMTGYGNDLLAPGYNLSGTADYQCAYNILKTHAEVYHLYNNTFKGEQQGSVTIGLNSPWYEPATNSENDIEAANKGLQFELGLFAHPIYSLDGDFPKVVKDDIGKRSKSEGFAESRLPKLTPEEISFIRGTSDYFALNHYVTALISSKQPDPLGTPSYEKDKNIHIFFDPTWPTTIIPDHMVVPWGLTRLLKWIKDEYRNPNIYITENGIGDPDDSLNDSKRVNYIQLYMKAVLDAIQNYGVKVKSYTVWSLMDNFEWAGGYIIDFGLYYVDFSTPSRPRTPRSSAEYYKGVIANKRP